MTRARNFLTRRDFLRRATLGLTGVLFALRGESKKGASNPTDGWIPLAGQESDLRLDNGRHLQITCLAQDKGAGRLVWLTGGEEADDAGGKAIRWNQPEVLRVAEEAPDKGATLLAYLEENHTELLAGLWGQTERSELAHAGLLLDWDVYRDTATTMTVPAAELQGGFTLAGWWKTPPVETADRLFLTMENEQIHLRLLLNPAGLQLLMADGAGELIASADGAKLADGTWHHVVLIADEDAGLLRWVVDGECQPGWTALSKPLLSRWEEMTLHLPQEGVTTGSLRFYNRPLRTAEAAASYRYYGQGMGSSAYWG